MIKVVPSLITADPSVRDVDVSRRRCRFPGEAPPGSSLSGYSHSGCAFECRARRARDLVGCVPWDFPPWGGPPGGPAPSVCSSWDARRFRQAVEDAGADGCGCAHDCEVTTYALAASAEELQVTVS